MVTIRSSQSITPPVNHSPKPIRYWAVIGGGVVLISLYVFTRWVAGPYFHRIHPGPTKVPTYMLIAVRTQETLGCILLGTLLYLFVVRPLIRERTIHVQGMLLLACCSVEWQDPGYNFFTYGFTNNAAAINFGTWMMYIPGWSSPNPGQYAEDIIMFGTFYGSVALLGALMTAKLMRWLKERRPQIGPFALVAFAYGVLVIVDFIIELIYMRTGMYFYTQVWKPMTVFYGKYYQFPLYEPLTWGATWTVFACMYYFRNDKGETLAERGASQLKTGRAKTKVVSLLAMIGMANVGYLFFYNVPNIFATLHASPWIQEHLKRSYVTNHLCGAETDYVCGGGGVPIIAPGGTGGKEAIHIRPDGTVSVPPDIVFPKEVPFDK